MMKNNKGFTLIELMTTVAIIGVLMLMAFPSYDSYVKRVKIVQELVLLQPVINMQKIEMAMGLPESGQTSDFLQSMRDQQDKSGEKGWLIGANNNPTCIGGSQFGQVVLQLSTSATATWSHQKHLGFSFDPNISYRIYISGFQNTTGNNREQANCSAGSYVTKNPTSVYFTQMFLEDNFLSSNYKNFSSSTSNETLTIVTIVGGNKIFYDTNGNVSRTSKDSTEMTCAIAPTKTMLNPAKFFSKINRSAIPTHCRWALMSQFLPQDKGVSTELRFMPL